MIKKELPSQFPNASIKVAIENTSAAVGSSASSLLISNLFISFLFSVSMNLVWELISAHQIVILFPLMNVQIP